MLLSKCSSHASCQITGFVTNGVVFDHDRDVMGQEKSFGKGKTVWERKMKTQRRKKNREGRSHGRQGNIRYGKKWRSKFHT